MAYFTTNLAELLTRARDAVASGDADLVLETYEFIARFHGEADVQTSISMYVADEALSRRQYNLASHALRKVAGDPLAYSSATPIEILSVAMRLGLLLSQRLLNFSHAKSYLKAYCECAQSNLDIAEAELLRIGKIEALRTVPGNPSDAKQDILLSSRVAINLPSIAEGLSELTGVSKFEFTRRMNPVTGIILKDVSDAENAEVVINYLAQQGIPSFYVASSARVADLQKLRNVTAVKIVEGGLEISAGASPTTLAWKDISLVDCGQVKYEEVIEETPGRVATSFLVWLNDHRVKDPEPKKRIAEKKMCVIAIIMANGAGGYVIDTENASILRPYAYTSTVVKSKEEWFAEEILGNSPNAFFGLGLHLLAADGVGGDWSGQVFRSAEEFNDHLGWLTILLRLGIT